MRFLGWMLFAAACSGGDDTDGSKTGTDDPTTTSEDCDSPETWYADADGDGYGVDETEVVSCNAPEGFVPYGGDCDDTHADVSPDARELCDDIDQDCDGSSLDGLVTFFADADEDGYGDELVESQGCEAPAGYVDNSLDCDDDAPTVYPGAPMTDPCDLVDTNCDGTLEEIVIPDAGTLDTFGSAPNGSTLCLRPGTHPAITLNAVDVTLQGIGADPSEVVIDGANATSAIALIASPGTTIRNLTATRGRAINGGGILAILSDLTLEDAVLEGNTCIGLCSGVGLYSTNSDLTLRRVKIRDNVAIFDFPNDEDMRGIGIMTNPSTAVTVLEDVEITGNAGSVAAGNTSRVEARGAGAFFLNGTVTMDRTLIAGNTWTGVETSYGGGMNLENMDATLRNVRIVGNESHNGRSLGGGLYLVAPTPSSLTLENVIIAGNVIESDGGVFPGTGAGIAKLLGYTLRATNVAIVGNVDLSPTSEGTALWDWGDAPGVFINSIVQGNRGPVDGPGALVRDGGQPTARYTTAWDNDGATWNQIWDPTGIDGNQTVDASFTDVSDPDPLLWDLTLQPGSALIDAGDPAILDPDGSASDIGPYGGPLGASW